MKNAVALLLLILLPSTSGLVQARDKSENGVFRPTLSTNPRSYLREFPLGKVGGGEIIQYVGTPDKTFSMGGADFITYNIATRSNSGIIEYTFEVKDGVVVNVTYLNSGNFFGVTQRESAKELQVASEK